MNYRESLSNTLNKSLQDREDGHESRIDRLTAFSMAPGSAGGLLWRLKYNNDSTAWQPAIEALADMLGEKPQWIELCLYEWLNTQCRACGGQQFVTIGERRVDCPRCNGTGLERHSDRARAHRAKVSMKEISRKNSRLTKIHNRIADLDRAVSVAMNLKLTD